MHVADKKKNRRSPPRDDEIHTQEGENKADFYDYPQYPNESQNDVSNWRSEPTRVLFEPSQPTRRQTLEDVPPTREANMTEPKLYVHISVSNGGFHSHLFGLIDSGAQLNLVNAEIASTFL